MNISIKHKRNETNLMPMKTSRDKKKNNKNVIQKLNYDRINQFWINKNTLEKNTRKRERERERSESIQNVWNF